MSLPEKLWNAAPWSYSKINLARTCPLAFHKRHILHERAVDVAQATTVGTVVHSILEWTDNGASIDTAFTRAGEVYDLTYEAALEVETFRDAVHDWVQGIKIFCEMQEVQTKFCEKKIALDGDFNITSYKAKNCFFRGNVDLILLTRRGKGVVIDHKSGVVKKIDYHKEQLEMYCIMVDALQKNLSAVRPAIHAAGAEKNARGSRMSWLPEYSVKDIRTRCRNNLIKLVTEASDVAADPNPQPKTGWMCNFCGYQTTCPKKT